MGKGKEKKKRRGRPATGDSAPIQCSEKRDPGVITTHMLSAGEEEGKERSDSQRKKGEGVEGRGGKSSATFFVIKTAISLQSIVLPTPGGEKGAEEKEKKEEMDRSIHPFNFVFRVSARAKGKKDDKKGGRGGKKSLTCFAWEARRLLSVIFVLNKRKGERDT